METSLSVQIAPKNKKGLRLKNPVMTASGTFGYGDEAIPLIDINHLGAIVTKGTTLKARAGNPQQRLAETPCGLLNSIGLQNIGVEALIKEKAPLWAQWQVPVIVNIAGESVEEYAELAKRLNSVAGVSALEVNISCPNVEKGGMEFGISASSAAEITGAVKRNTGLPVIVKLSPNVTDIAAIALAVEDAGADALTVINTLRGMAININTRKPVLGNIFGGLSGPAIKPIALYMVYKVAKAVKIPVLGCGGIMTAADALEFIMAGATAVQIGTANLIDPATAIGIIQGIEDFMKSEVVEDINQLIGVISK